MRLSCRKTKRANNLQAKQLDHFPLEKTKWEAPEARRAGKK